MRVKELVIHNTRGFTEAKVPVHSGMTVLVGPNGSGKSTVLDALEFALEGRVPEDFKTQSSILFVDFLVSSEDAEVLLRASLDERGRRKLEQCHLIPQSWDKAPQDQTVAELKVSLGPEMDLPALKDELLAAAVEFARAAPPSTLKSCWGTPDKTIAKSLPRVSRFSAESLLDVEKAIGDLLLREASSFAIANGELWDRLNGAFSASLDAVAKALSDKATQYAPDVLDALRLDAELDRNRPRLIVDVLAEQQGKRVAFGALSLGQRRRLNLAVADALTERLQKSNEVLVYDEPDAHLDNRAQAQLVRVLAEQSEMDEIQVVVATHAPRVINATHVSTIVHLRPLDNGIEVRNFSDLVDSDHQDLLRDLDESLDNTSLFQDSVLVICEGVSEREAIPILYRRRYGISLAASGISLISRRGCGDARRMAQMMHGSWGGQWMLLLDADQKATTDREFYGVGIVPHYVGDLELEDCFEDSSWVKVINDAVRDEGLDATVSTQDLAGWRADTRKAISKHIEKWMYDNKCVGVKDQLLSRVAEECDLGQLGSGLSEFLGDLHGRASRVND